MKYLSFPLFLFCTLSALAQEDSVKKIIAQDSIIRARYVSHERDFISIYVYGSRYSNGILYGGNSQLFYYPITPVNIGIGASHKWLGGSVSLVSIESSRKKFIDNYNFNIALNAYGRKIGADISYTLNSGYYQANYKSFLDYDQVNKSQPYFNMRMQRVILNFVRIFNGKKYSLNAPIDQGEIQKKSAGSFLMNMGLSLAFAENGDSSFVPSYVNTVFKDNALLKKGVFYSLDFMPGYGFTFVIKKRFFVGVVPSVGISIQYQTLDFVEGHEEKVRISYQALGRFGAGYQSERWTFGISALFDVENYPLGKGTYLLNNVGRVYARVGYKLDVPKWARKYSKKMDNYQQRLENALPIN